MKKIINSSFIGRVSGEELTDLSSLFEHLLSNDEHNVNHLVNINIGCKVLQNIEFISSNNRTI